MKQFIILIASLVVTLMSSCGLQKASKFLEEASKKNDQQTVEVSSTIGPVDTELTKDFPLSGEVALTEAIERYSLTASSSHSESVIHHNGYLKPSKNDRLRLTIAKKSIVLPDESMNRYSFSFLIRDDDVHKVDEIRVAGLAGNSGFDTALFSVVQIHRIAMNDGYTEFRIDVVPTCQGWWLRDFILGMIRIQLWNSNSQSLLQDIRFFARTSPN